MNFEHGTKCNKNCIQTEACAYQELVHSLLSTRGGRVCSTCLYTELLDTIKRCIFRCLRACFGVRLISSLVLSSPANGALETEIDTENGADDSEEYCQ